MRKRVLVSGVLVVDGVVLALVPLAHLVSHTEPALPTVLGKLLPLVAALGVVAAGGWLYRSAFDTAELVRFVGWSVIGQAGMGVFAALVAVHIALAYGSVLPGGYSLYAGGNVVLGGAIGGLAIAFYDVRSRRRERAIRRERNHLEEVLRTHRNFFETVRDMVFVATPDGELRSVNPALERRLGYDAETLEGQHLSVFLPSETDAETGLDRFDGEPERFESEFETSDGDVRSVEVTTSRIDYFGEGAILGIARDVTERDARERTLEQYERAVEASDDLIVAVDADGAYQFANSTYCAYYGVEDVEGRRVPDVVGREVFEGAIAPYHERALEGVSVAYERTETFPELGERTLAVSYTPIRDGSSVTGLVAVLRDVTERRAYEQRLEDQRDDLEMLNQVVRHDIRNDLQLIAAYGEMLAEYVGAEGREYLDVVIETTENAVDLTTTARDLAEVMLRSDAGTRPIPLGTTLEGQLEEVRAGHPEAAVTVDGSLPSVAVQANQMLAAVFRNLLSNAIQHNDGDVPEVTVSATVDGDRAIVRVADDGPGVPDAAKADIFGKGEKGLESGGTGIGLYLVQSLVDGYGGEVRVEDNEPAGAVFVVELPVVDGP